MVMASAYGIVCVSGDRKFWGAIGSTRGFHFKTVQMLGGDKTLAMQAQGAGSQHPRLTTWRTLILSDPVPPSGIHMHQAYMWAHTCRQNSNTYKINNTTTTSLVGMVTHLSFQ